MKFHSRSKWSENEMIELVKEIIVENPLKCKKGSNGGSLSWEEITKKFSDKVKVVTRRQVQERYNVMKRKFEQQMNAQKRGSGIACSYEEFEQLMQQI